MPRSIALCTTRLVAAKSMRPPKLLPPRPTTETSSAELPSLHLPIAPNSELSCYRNDRVRASRFDDGVQHRHAVQHLIERDRVGLGCADRARERGEFRVEHVEAGMLADLVGWRNDRSARRPIRDRHEARRLQVGLGNLGQALAAVERKGKI